jgi:hypothetical protein
MNHSNYRTIVWVTIFSIAMGFFESSVVVYLRALYYPLGFSFPLKIIAHNIAVTEIFREFATLVMLVGIGIIAGRTRTEKFAYFIYSFAFWDIFYYVFLKILLGWPESFLTWDILFLIPTTWVGPVIAPVINSCTMILLALCIIHFTGKKGSARLNVLEWSLLITGSLIVILAYTKEYSGFMLQKFSWGDLFSENKKEAVMEYAATFVPQKFNWLLFSVGESMHLGSIALFCRRQKRFVF